MSGETNLTALLAAMNPELHPDTYVFATVPAGFPMDGLSPRLVFAEDEGTTLILPRAEAEEAGLIYTFESRMITLNIHSSLEAVGFLAVVTARLAALAIGVNPVSAYYHDHLFVPADRAETALQELIVLAREHA